VSGGVAKKEHSEFSSNIDLIDTLPPGLYEAVFESKDADTSNPELATGHWVMRCEMRTLDDIRALVGSDATDERRFATAARVSDSNLAMYRTFVQPFVRAFVNTPLSNWMHQLHPLRLQYEMLSDANPLMASVGRLAEEVRERRQPVANDNPFLAMQEAASRQIIQVLDAWRVWNEILAERIFLGVYGSRTLQAAVGIDPERITPLRKSARSPLYRELLEKRIAELKSRIPLGGLREAIVRSLLYAGMARAAIDERGFETVRRIREEESDLPLSAFKTLLREQFFMLLIDSKAALEAIPAMLPADPEVRQKALDLIHEVMRSRGDLSAEDRRRLNEISNLFDVGKRQERHDRQAGRKNSRTANRQKFRVVEPNRTQVKAS
ncbi:MAG TPA: DUF3141 domain-containing protein, partial [Xanthobacteraceae bacterium]|nr:DUF3141 domain-containing protein [Xanthobacteraceae bacterium]